MFVESVEFSLLYPRHNGHAPGRDQLDLAARLNRRGRWPAVGDAIFEGRLDRLLIFINPGGAHWAFAVVAPS